MTAENVFQLTDMAEFFAVPTFKEYCDEFLCKARDIITVENVEDMFEYSQKYSLLKMKDSLGKFIQRNIDKIINSERFLSSKKSFVDFLYSSCDCLRRDKFFEGVSHDRGKLVELSIYVHLF